MSTTVFSDDFTSDITGWRARTNSTVSHVSGKLRVKAAAAGTIWDADNDRGRFRILPSTEYRMSSTVANRAGGSRTFRMAIEIISSAGAVLGGFYVDNTVPAATTESQSKVFTTHDTAYEARLILRGSSPSAGDEMDWDDVLVAETAVAVAPTLTSTSVTDVTSTAATISTTTKDADAVRVVVKSGATTVATGTNQTPDINGVATHNFGGLTAGTGYSYDVVMVQGTTETTAAGAGTFTTKTAVAAPTITANTVSNITSSAATVALTTSNATSVALELLDGATGAVLSTTSSQTPDAGGGTTFSLLGLNAETAYAYRGRLTASDGSVVTVTPAGNTFTTLAAVSSTAVSEYIWYGGQWHPVTGTGTLDPGGGGGEEPVPEPPPSGDPNIIRVDVGGDGGVFSGLQWSADSYVGGQAYTISVEDHPDMVSQIGETAALYFTHRHGVDGQPLTISVPTDLTRALFRIHQLEPTFSAAGRRRYAWHTSAGRVTEQIDLAASQGLRRSPLVTEIVVDVVGGVASVSGVPEVDNAIVAAVEMLDGAGRQVTPVISEPAPPPPPPAAIAFSQTADRSNPRALDGYTLPNQKAAVFISGDYTRVDWHQDQDPTSPTPTFTDTTSPFDLAGGTLAAANLVTFSTGTHTVHAVCTHPDGTKTTSSATFVSPSPAVTPPPPTGIVSDGAGGRQAGPADRVSASVGVNVHFNYGSYKRDAPGGLSAIADRIVEGGLRHVRDDSSTNNMGTLKRLGEAGVKWWPMFHGSSGSANISSTAISNIKSLVQYVDGLLAVNEPDNTSASSSVIRQQQIDVWNAYRAHREFDHLPVTTWASTFPRTAKNVGVGDVSAYADGGDFHPYPAGQRPDTNAGHNTLAELAAMKDRLNGDPHLFAPADWDFKDAWKRGGSFYTLSETGWHNNITDKTEGHRGVPRDVAALYAAALLLWYDLHGFARMHFYEMLNQAAKGPENGSSIQGSFGLVDQQLNPKPIFTAVKNFQSLYTDRGVRFTPGTLDVTSSGKTAKVLDTLHQRRDGTFLLGVWNGVIVWNDRDYVRLPTPADVPVSYRFNKRNVAVRVYEPHRGSVPGAWTNVAKGTDYRVPVGPGAKILEIRAQ